MKDKDFLQIIEEVIEARSDGLESRAWENIKKKLLVTERENKELKEDIIDCLEELTEGNTITPRVAEYFDYMRERYLGKWGGKE